MIAPCCCITLRTGGFLIGILEIVSWSVSLTISAAGLMMTSAADKKLNNAQHWKANNASSTMSTLNDNSWHDERDYYYSRTTTPTPDETTASTAPPPSGPSVQEMLTMAYIITSLCLVLSIVRIFNGAVLLLGIQKNNQPMLKCWLIVKSLVLFLTICLFLTSLFSEQFRAGNIIYYAVSIAGGFYFLWVIVELHAEMKAGKNPIRNPKPKA